jgi:hypothetical protein
MKEVSFRFFTNSLFFQKLQYLPFFRYEAKSFFLSDNARQNPATHNIKKHIRKMSSID